MTTTHERILILDFGSQVTQLIARRVREAGVYCEIHPFTMDKEKIRAFAPKGIIFSGGPNSVYGDAAPTVDKAVLEMGIPVLGICYGEQLICSLLGGKVTGGGTREFGRAEIKVTAENALFKDVWKRGEAYPVWMSHGDKVDQIPEGFVVTAKSAGAPYAAIANEAKRIYAMQFHPEVAHTPDGAKLLSNFVRSICGCHSDWSMKGFREEEIARIRAKVGTDKVICGVSGGVDSLVAAKIIHEAIGDQLTCIFVNTGVLRKGEAEQVQKSFREHYHIPLVYVDASERFLTALKGVSDPEKKRKIIGGLFIEVFDAEAEKITDAKWLAQGTLYPDVIESVSFNGGPSHVIKSHHNVGGLPEDMKLGLVEPLRELFKDEVRKLGLELGLPHAMVYRHPFPGPGLAIRIPGEVTPEKVAILQEADAIYIDELRKNDLYDKIWQAFAVLLPVSTVGVMGDARTYESVCGLRAVTSTDGMTADVFPFPHDVLLKISSRIVNEVRGINRVVYDITQKPPATIEWE